MDKAFDKAQLAHLDVNTNEMVNKHYELCLYRCSETRMSNSGQCKHSCFTNIQVPYKHANHMARDSEENEYRKCLGNVPNFPNVQREDFITCSNGLFANRVETLSNHMADEAVKIFAQCRD